MDPDANWWTKSEAHILPVLRDGGFENLILSVTPAEVGEREKGDSQIMNLSDRTMSRVCSTDHILRR